MNKVLGKVIVGFAASATVATLGISSAFAGTTSFDTQYKNNSTLEQSLLAQVQSSSSEATVSALLSTVQNINTQVASLYTAEQALANAKSSIPQVNTNTAAIKKLEQKREQLLKQSNADWKLVGKYKHNSRDKKSLKNAVKDYNDIEKKLSQINHEIDQDNHDDGWKTQPYDTGLKTLQDSILKLQSSAIFYTKEAIAVQSATNQTPTGSTSAPTGSTPAPTDSTPAPTDSTPAPSGSTGTTN